MINPSQRIRDSLIGATLVGHGGTRFHVRSLLGEGGQGWVYKANYDDPDGFWLVVKLLRPEGVSREALDRFERESQVLQMLGGVATPNPNIVRFFDHGIHTLRLYGVEQTLPFIALEYVDGPTLAKVVDDQRGEGLSIGRALRILKQVARALATVHSNRIVHRDLKPSNILLATVDGREVAKVTDFGLVKAPDFSMHATVTIAGASLGYAPPEQYEMGNSRVGPQTDVFSFAAIVFELLSGQGAFPHNAGDSPLRIVARMLTGQRPQLARHRGSLPEELRDRPDLIAALDETIGRATAPDPAHRQASIAEFWSAIETTLRVVYRDRSLEPPDDAATRVVSKPAFRAAMPWNFSQVGPAIERDRLRSAVVAPEEGTIYAVGSQAIYRWFRGDWAPIALPSHVDVRSVRGIARTRGGELLLHGEVGLAMLLSLKGGTRAIPGTEGDHNWLGAFTDDGDVLLCGERRSQQVGVIAETSARGAHVRTLNGTTRLFGITRLASGALLACGSHGDLVQVLASGSTDVPWGRSGHLYSLARRPDGGAYAVGSGGHALSLSTPPVSGPQVPTFSVVLEAVQTTRDLWTVRVDGRGNAWAAGSQGRLLARNAGVWERVALGEVTCHLISLAAHGEKVTVVGEDGTVLEGNPGEASGV